MYAIILVFLGGIIIVFLYVRIISLDHKISFPHENWGLLGFSFIMPVIFYNLHIKERALIPIGSSSLLSVFFSCPQIIAILFLISYLLIALFLVVILAQSFKGAIFKLW